MTDITKQALEAAHAHILDSYRVWQADDISAIPPSGSSAGKALALISAALSVPIDPKAEVHAYGYFVKDFADGWIFFDNEADANRERAATGAMMLVGVHPASPSIVAPVGVPDGWQLVPKEPTEEMIVAGCHHENLGDMAGRYRAMLTAAPALTPAEKAGVGDGELAAEIPQDVLAVAHKAAVDWYGDCWLGQGEPETDTFKVIRGRLAGAILADRRSREGVKP